MATYRVKVNDRTDVPLEISDIEKLDFIETGENRLHVLHNNQSFEAEILSVDVQNETVVLRVNGEKFVVRVADPYDQLVNQMGLTAVVHHKINQVKAPMPGLVLEILVEPGQEVLQGDSLIILEAMKMENIIKSPGEGKIKRIAVEKGKPVEKGAILIELE